MTAFQKAVKMAFQVRDNNAVFPDKMICKKDGSVEVKVAYFYRHGQTAESWGQKVQGYLAKAVPGAVVIEARDDFKGWPQTSYFVAVVAEKA